MDEAVIEALRAIRSEVMANRHDFRAHVIEDKQQLKEIGEQIATWSGQIATIKWLSSAILAAIVAYGAKHW